MEITPLLADITTLDVDAIVNAANTALAGGSGVDGAIHRAAGPELAIAATRLGPCPAGGAVLTPGFRLPARFVIHAVGPAWRGHTPAENDRLLASATSAALEIARDKGLQGIAFPAISSGIFGFPKDRCAQVMIRAVAGWAADHPDDPPRDLHFTIIDDVTVNVFAAELGRVFGDSR